MASPLPAVSCLHQGRSAGGRPTDFWSHATVVVVKAQIHAGGRGKGGGVKLARSSDEAADLASHMLGMKLVTHQTGPAGRIVKRLLIEEGLDIKRELYLGLASRFAPPPRHLHGQRGRRHGNRKEVAKDNPAAILREPIHPALGLAALSSPQDRLGLGLPGEVANSAIPFLQALYRCFIDTDASMLEINPVCSPATVNSSRLTPK